jgi:Rrf2 family protein
MMIRRDRGMLAVLIMLDVAFHAGRTSTVSAADIADRAGLARRGIEPLLQTLSRSGLLESIRGPRGGYRLGRPRRDIHLDAVVKTAIAEDAAAEEGPTAGNRSALDRPGCRSGGQAAWFDPRRPDPKGRIGRARTAESGAHHLLHLTSLPI